MDDEIINFYENIDFTQRQHKEKNLFDSGINNMYENPFTEILSFILKPNSLYVNRDKFIQYFILGLTGNEFISKSFCEEINVETQINTRAGKYIDMLLYNDEYVIALENKIGHIPINPFEDYEEEIKIRFISQEKHFYLFSLYSCEDIDKWNNKLIGDVFSKIKNIIKHKFNNKWDYFVNDFLDHYIEEKIIMTEKNFEYFEKNFSKFIQGRNLFDQFIDQIVEKLPISIKPESIRRQNWEGCFVLRLKPFKIDCPDIVLCLNYDNTLSTIIYYDDQSGKTEIHMSNPFILVIANLLFHNQQRYLTFVVVLPFAVGDELSSWALQPLHHLTRSCVGSSSECRH
jgi:hypothetical protein